MRLKVRGNDTVMAEESLAGKNFQGKLSVAEASSV